jgi:hypothetical protein
MPGTEWTVLMQRLIESAEMEGQEAKPDERSFCETMLTARETT